MLHNSHDPYLLLESQMVNRESSAAPLIDVSAFFLSRGDKLLALRAEMYTRCTFRSKRSIIDALFRFPSNSGEMQTRCTLRSRRSIIDESFRFPANSGGVNHGCSRSSRP